MKITTKNAQNSAKNGRFLVVIFREFSKNRDFLVKIGFCVFT